MDIMGRAGPSKWRAEEEQNWETRNKTDSYISYRIIFILERLNIIEYLRGNYQETEKTLGNPLKRLIGTPVIIM